MNPLQYMLFIIIVSKCCSAYSPEIVSLNYSTTYNFTVNSSIEYILEFTDDNNFRYSELPPRIWVESNATPDAPLMIVARQTKEMLSWQLPLELELEGSEGETIYNYTSRTMCHDIIKHYRKEGRVKINHENPILSVATSSNTSVKFSVNVHHQTNFSIQLNREYNFTITPSEPRYFFYNFTTNSTLLKKGDSNYETVILEVNSDDICMTVSIQNISCPVFDTNQDVTFRGFYETVNRKGGITIPKYKFPHGFYVVFVAKADDYACTKGSGFTKGFDGNGYPFRRKQISMIIKPSITYSDYVKAVLLTLACIGAFYIIFGLPYFVYTVKCTASNDLTYLEESYPSTPSGLIINSEMTTQNPSTSSTNARMDGQSVDMADFDTLNEVDSDRNLRLGRGQPYLVDLARKHPKELKRRSYLYLYNVLTVALFYALPVVQLVVTYQRVLNETGQQDLCYYNFLCAHPLGLLSDFNHVLSNIGYVLLGVLFLIITALREHMHTDYSSDRQYGIPQHYGLFYAMGVALIMEGVLSGSYHVCPNQLNFQFDSSFMYVMAVLCMVKLYQNRHPDINANAYTTFGVLAIAVVLAMIGIFEGTTFFWSIFVIIHISMCFYLSVKVYYMGCWRLSDVSMQRMKQVWVYDFWSGPVNVLRPCHKARFVLLLLGNFCNWGLATFALYRQPKNFPVFLLTIFMANTLLYYLFYIVMKYVNKERVKLLTWMFLLISNLCAGCALYFFLHKSISWKRTAAQSRQLNSECVLLRFYDYHDIWHFMSAIGMFFTFMTLLTLDDDLIHTPHTQIPVF